jgi:riboflavin kinase / FMN adenylyltransferase
MQVHFGLELLNAEWANSVVCVGTFDGVHLGHQAVIGRAVNDSAQRELPCIVVTFDRHPAHILSPERCPKAIESLGENLEQFERLGVGVAVVLPFTKELSQTSAQTFFDGALVGALRATRLVVGHDFAFGKGREGTPEWLKARIDTEVVPPYELHGSRVSSSAVRNAIAEGDIEEAERLLGRPFAISGIVVAGQRLGRTLGYPTANLARSFDQVTPAHGIYGGYATTPHGTFRAAVSIGVKPAVGGKDQTIEAFLLDYPGHELYGRNISVSLHRRIREERNFESLEALRQQIARDVAVVASL